MKPTLANVEENSEKRVKSLPLSRVRIMGILDLGNSTCISLLDEAKWLDKSSLEKKGFILAQGLRNEIVHHGRDDRLKRA